MEGRILRDVPIDGLVVEMHSILSLWAIMTGVGLLREITIVPVCKSTDRIFRQAVTFTASLG